MPLATVSTPEDRLLDLRLFHHYHKMANQATQSQNIWSTWIAEESVGNPILMDAVLGFSAFHLRHLNDADPAVCKASHMYMARAIRSHNENLQEGINEENADSVLAVASLILFHASVNQPYLNGPEEGYRLPLHWFRPYQGAAAFCITIWPLIKDRHIGKLLRSRLTSWPPTTPFVSTSTATSEFDFLLDDLDINAIDSETIEIYRLAVANLSYIFSSPQYDTLLRFPAIVSARFIELLEAKDPRTLAIAGYFFMLLKIARPLWWVDGAPEREFRAIMAFLPRDWWHVMAWAISEFEWSPED